MICMFNIAYENLTFLRINNENVTICNDLFQSNEKRETTTDK